MNTPTDTEATLPLQLIDAFEEYLPQFAEQTADMVMAAQFPSYVSFSREQIVRSSTAALGMFVRSLRENSVQPSVDHWTRVASMRVEQGINIDELLSIIFGAGEVYSRFVFATFGDNLALYIWWLQQLHKILTAEAQALGRVFVAAREQVIYHQSAQIRELSTPLIPLYAGVLMLPIVGAVDSTRSGQIMEALLTGIAAHQAEVVILDITGMPAVDMQVAAYLVQAARAARLLGAQVVLVGMRAEIAQTMTRLDLDLGQFVTRANVQSGIEYALALQEAMKPARSSTSSPRYVRH